MKVVPLLSNEDEGGGGEQQPGEQEEEGPQQQNNQPQTEEGQTGNLISSYRMSAGMKVKLMMRSFWNELL